MSTVRRVLVIDDEAAIREIVDLALTLEGYEVLTAADGASGLELLQRRQPDVVLLDMKMPVMDGSAFMQAYRALPAPRPRVIVFTAAQDALARAAEVQADAFLSKPFDLADLLSQLEFSKA